MHRVALSKTGDIFVIQNFFTPEECKQHIDQAERIGFSEADISYASGAKMDRQIRNNSRARYTDQAQVEKIWERLHSLLPEEIRGWTLHSLNPDLRYYKYEVGQKFNTHRDGTVKINDNLKSRFSFLIYLNEDFEGGETTFENTSVLPTTGTALLFAHRLLHSGSEVIRGKKYLFRSDIFYQKK